MGINWLVLTGNGMVCKARNRWRQQSWRVGCWHSLAVCEADICMRCVVSQFIEVHGSMKPFTTDDEVKWLAFSGMQWTSEIRQSPLFLWVYSNQFDHVSAAFDVYMVSWLKAYPAPFTLYFWLSISNEDFKSCTFILTFCSHQVTSKASSFHECSLKTQTQFMLQVISGSFWCDWNWWWVSL